MERARSRHLAIVNFRSIGTALAQLSPQNNAIPRLAYLMNFARRRIKDREANFDEGFSVVLPTRNRKEFLSCAVTAVVSNTQLPFELIIMDNASNDGTSQMCQTLEKKHPYVVRHVRLERNYGTNAYALDGGKHDISKYSESTVSDTTLQIGPTGGWFAVTTRPIYNEVGGFIFRPYKPFPAEDGKYIRKLSKKDYFAGILKKAFVYHASGPYWNRAYGYSKMWEEKYQRHHKDFLPLIHDVQIHEVPSPQYAQAMVIKAEPSYEGSA